MTASKVQKITFLIFKSLTLRQITALYRMIKCGFFCFARKYGAFLRASIFLTTIPTTITHFGNYGCLISFSMRSALSRRIPYVR